MARPMIVEMPEALLVTGAKVMLASACAKRPAPATEVTGEKVIAAVAATSTLVVAALVSGAKVTLPVKSAAGAPAVAVPVRGVSVFEAVPWIREMLEALPVNTANVEAACACARRAAVLALVKAEKLEADEPLIGPTAADVLVRGAKVVDAVPKIEDVTVKAEVLVRGASVLVVVAFASTTLVPVPVRGDSVLFAVRTPNSLPTPVPTSAASVFEPTALTTAVAAEVVVSAARVLVAVPEIPDEVKMNSIRPSPPVPETVPLLPLPPAPPPGVPPAAPLSLL